MKWTEVRLITTEEAYDAVSDMLTSIGAGGVVIEDPNEIRRQIESPGSLDYADEEFMNSLGVDVTIKAYFHGDYNISELEQLIKEKIVFISRFLDTGKGYTGYSEVDDEDWATAWKKHYKPFHISGHIVIKPSWEEYAAAADEIVIELDPGMAFGTGTHETTRLCAQFLEKYLKVDDSVIDVGCGTGILSIIAAKLGAKSVAACDIDKMAVRITGENCLINGVSEKVSVSDNVLKDLKCGNTDIIVANIIADVIVDIAGQIPHYLKKDGYFITSGIIKERKNEVIEAYCSKGFVLESLLELGEWVAIVFRCQDSL